MDNEKLKTLRKALHFSQKEMAEILGIKQNGYSSIESGKVSFTDRNKEILANTFGILPSWFDNDNVPMFLNRSPLSDLIADNEWGRLIGNDNTEVVRKAALETIQKRKNPLLTIENNKSLNLLDKIYSEKYLKEGTNAIHTLKKQQTDVSNSNPSLLYPIKPFIDSVYAVCGTPSGFSIAIKEAECEGLSLPFMKEYDFSIRAKGDSMINRSNPARSIRDNDIVVCRLWTSRSHVRWGEVYALATGDGVIVKKIMPSDKESFIKCVSFNEEDGYPPYELPLQEVHDWAIVTGVVSARNWN